MSQPRPLTPKQQAFVREYLITLNGADAARKAGYRTTRPDALAYDLLRKPEIESAIRTAIEARAEKTEITAEQVLTKLWTEAQRQGIGASHAARIRALELVGRHVGLKFVDSYEHSGPGGAPIPLSQDLSKLSEAELTQLAELLLKAIPGAKE